MNVDIMTVGPIQTNAYLATCRQTREAVLIDPGWDDPSIIEAIEARQANVRYIVNTHAHWDHICGNAALHQQTGAPLAIHQDDIPLLRNKGGADEWQIPMQPSPEPAHLLVPGEVLEVGKLRFKILFTPGHTPGHVSLYEEAKKTLFDGDVIFKQGIGRTDLPGGDMRAMMNSIKNVLLKLPDDVVVYPGHGPTTTIGEERASNPWLL
jgi:hydroxyacylglutathione hydrolase